MASRATRKRRKILMRDFVRYLKEKKGCKNCGGRNDLTFHHRIKKNKRGRVDSTIASNASWKKFMAEVVKCDVLCDPCHVRLHQEIG